MKPSYIVKNLVDSINILQQYTQML